MDILRRIAKQARVRDLLHAYLSRPNLSAEQVSWLRSWWNRWCRYCLVTKEKLDYMSPQWRAWPESVRVVLTDAVLSLDFAGFQFPGVVELKPDSGRALRFGSPLADGILRFAFPGATFHGSFFCEGPCEIGSADFNGVRFVADASFGGLTFKGNANFRGTLFEGGADFFDTKFHAGADFERGIFQGQTNFELARFAGCARTLSGKCCASFSGATFKAVVSFKSAYFGRSAFFRNTVFEKPAIFTHKLFSLMRLSSTRRSYGSMPDEQSSSVRFGGDVSFEHARFLDSAHFSGTIFDDEVDFSFTEFVDDAYFQNIISKMMDFSGVTFNKSSHFVKATFNGASRFFNTTFHGDANFAEATFESSANFTAVRFKAIAILDEACFSAGASFRHLTSKQIFSLRAVKFARMPDFIQAHFKEPPDLDLIEIGREAPGLSPEELTARWRALKRMAMQTGHHYYTALFAAEETKARRPIDLVQRPWAWVIGWIYQGLSNFGLSVGRPVAIWLASMLYLAMYYSFRSGNERVGNCVTLVTGDPDASGRVAAVLYSLKKALVVSGFAKVQGLNDFTDCLYNGNMPLDVLLVGIAHSTFSGLLILLFVLAIRNHMRAR